MIADSQRFIHDAIVSRFLDHILGIRGAIFPVGNSMENMIEISLDYGIKS